MSGRVEILARANAGIEAALARRGHSTSSATEGITIVSSWDSVSSLCKLVDSRPHCLVIEDAGAGSVAIGPSFTPDIAGCFRCYLARRRSNGGAHCRPALVVSEPI